jgi:hypothetical protein
MLLVHARQAVCNRYSGISLYFYNKILQHRQWKIHIVEIVKKITFYRAFWSYSHKQHGDIKFIVGWGR